MAPSDAPRARHDWRFLLPERCVGVDAVVVGDDGSGRVALIESGLVSKVHDSVASVARPVGLVVVLSRVPVEGDDHSDLGRCIGPDTTVILESARWRRPWRSGWRKWCKVAGLVVEARYLVAPDHPGARWMASVDGSRAPLCWYLGTVSIPGARAGAMAQGFVRAVVRSVGTGPLSVVAPRRLVVAGPPGAPRQIIASPERDLGGDPGVPLLMGSSQDDRSRAVVAWFPLGARTPTSVVKFAASPMGNARNEAEHARLGTVRTALAAVGGADSVPRPLGAGTVGALGWIEQSASPAERLDRRLGNIATSDAAAAAALGAVAEWICRHARATATPDPVPGGVDAWHRLVAG